MAQASSICQYAHARFLEAFGPPHNTLGKDDHWKLQSSPNAMPINVVLNGAREDAEIWIFDSHDRDDDVFTASVTRQDQMDAIIEQIQGRVKRAGGSARPPTAHA